MIKDLFYIDFPTQCKSHAGLVHVSLIDATDDLRLTFHASSLSRPLFHTVTIQVVNQSLLYSLRDADEITILRSKSILVDSTDEFWKYSGGSYNATIGGYALVPNYTSPKSDSHDFLCGHTVLAVLTVLKQQIIPALNV